MELSVLVNAVQVQPELMLIPLTCGSGEIEVNEIKDID